MMRDQGGRYDRSYRIPSTTEQDQRMRDTAGRNLDNPYSANPFDTNRYHCGDLVNDTLEAGGISHGNEAFGNPPNDAFDKIRIANPDNTTGTSGPKGKRK